MCFSCHTKAHYADHCKHSRVHTDVRSNLYTFIIYITYPREHTQNINNLIYPSKYEYMYVCSLYSTAT